MATLTPADETAWAELEWDSIRTLLAVELIRRSFGVDVSVDELLRVTSDGGGDVRDAAALVARWFTALVSLLFDVPPPSFD